MRISAELIGEIVAHSRTEVPNECCGMIAGANGTATRVFRTRNSEASPFRFVIHPNDQLRVIDEIEAAGEELVAIYHSHTKSEAYPSQTDVNMARMWPDPAWLICSLADPEQPVVRAFEISDGGVTEIDIEVT